MSWLTLTLDIGGLENFDVIKSLYPLRQAFPTLLIKAATNRSNHLCDVCSIFMIQLAILYHRHHPRQQGMSPTIEGIYKMRVHNIACTRKKSRVVQEEVYG